MAKPESVKVEPWADFPRQSYSIFTDDFVHDKLFTLKLNAKGQKSSASAKFSLKALHNDLQDEIKLWFGLRGDRTLFAKIKSSDYLKVHYDNGIVERWGYKWNHYGSVNTSKALSKLNVRVGAHALSDKLNSDNRFKFDYSDNSSPNTTWYNRTLYNQDKFTFGLVSAFAFSRRAIVKNDFLIGYRVDDKSSFFLRAETDGYRKEGLTFSDITNNPKSLVDKFRLDFVSAYKQDVKYGVEVS